MNVENSKYFAMDLHYRKVKIEDLECECLSICSRTKRRITSHVHSSLMTIMMTLLQPVGAAHRLHKCMIRKESISNMGSPTNLESGTLFFGHKGRCAPRTWEYDRHTALTEVSQRTVWTRRAQMEVSTYQNELFLGKVLVLLIVWLMSRLSCETYSTLIFDVGSRCWHKIVFRLARGQLYWKVSKGAFQIL